MGIEMEGGRPGWYDALNGLPGLLGSSMVESCELARLLHFTAGALDGKDANLCLYSEILLLITHVDDILKEETNHFARWDRMNQVKEAYRKETLYGYRGGKLYASCPDLSAALRRMEDAVTDGIRRAESFSAGILPTYFTYEAAQTVQTPEGLLPKRLIPTPLPLFLEGPVRYLKLPGEMQRKQRMAEAVRCSGLYDQKLHMYKVNESLCGVSYEAGRALVFTPGWLENESIWLHMEYKYLLELLKNGLYEEFSQAFQDAAIPFLDPGKYGRSPLENVSFLASSTNPDKSIHGRGFVARLSGSTAEFIHIWQVLFFGSQPFTFENNSLQLRFDPYLPAYLIPEDGILEATFLGTTAVTYDCRGLNELAPGITAPCQYTVTYTDGTVKTYATNTLEDSCSAYLCLFFIKEERTMNPYFNDIRKNFGFGFMRLPMIDDDVDIPQTAQMVDTFLSNGFNYFDTAHGYINGKSELALKECLTSRYPRDRYILTNKLSGHCFEKEEDILPLFQTQLEACGVEYFDFYLMHAQNRNNFQTFKENHAYEISLKLREEGKIRHLGISFHDKAEILDQILTEYPQIEVVQIQFNYVDYEDDKVESRKCYEVCRKHGKPVIVMEPVKGGSLVNLPAVAQNIFDQLNGGSNASYAIRYAAGFEGMMMVLSGMSNMEQMNDNVSFMKSFAPLNKAEQEAVAKVCAIFRNQGLIACTACRYCTEVCPQGIAIPDIFAALNAKRQETQIPEVGGTAPSECIRCGKCEQICPQTLKIRELLVVASEEL